MYPDMKRFISVAVLVCAFVASTTKAWSQTSNYVIGAQDVLNVSVFDQPDLTGKFTVNEDGSFTFPLVGRVQAAGLTLPQLEEELKKMLADGFFKNPQITVAVDQYRSQRVFVVGEVRNPGTYPLTGDMTLIEALARAGSTNDYAGSEVLIVRSRSDHPATGPVLPEAEAGAEVVRANMKELQSGKLSDNVQLRDGDTIFVPRAELVYVFGQVKNPGSYALQKDMTVLQALSLAGGLTDRGASGRLRVVRIVNGKRTERKIELEDPVLAGDTIVVPERFF